MVYHIMIYKFELQHFFIKCIFFFVIQKSNIENPKFNFLIIICEIRKKCKFAKLFVSIPLFNTKYVTYVKNVEMENYLPR